MYKVRIPYVFPDSQGGFQGKGVIPRKLLKIAIAGSCCW